MNLQTVNQLGYIATTYTLFFLRSHLLVHSL